MSETERLLALILDTKRSFQQGCGSETPTLMASDLALFCCADRTCFDPDPHRHAMMAGRREVWLRIQEFLKLTPQELLLLYYTPVHLDGDDDA